MLRSLHLSQDKDSDDHPAVLSLCGMSSPERVLSDEESLMGEIKAFNNPDESTETEGAVVVS